MTVKFAVRRTPYDGTGLCLILPTFTLPPKTPPSAPQSFHPPASTETEYVFWLNQACTQCKGVTVISPAPTQVIPQEQRFWLSHTPCTREVIFLWCCWGHCYHFCTKISPFTLTCFPLPFVFLRYEPLLKSGAEFGSSRTWTPPPEGV